jgi:hypothetical protein
MRPLFGLRSASVVGPATHGNEITVSQPLSYLRVGRQTCKRWIRGRTERGLSITSSQTAATADKADRTTG